MDVTGTFWHGERDLEDVIFVEEEAEEQEEEDVEQEVEENAGVPNMRGLKHQDPLSLEAFFLDELSREIGYETDEDAIIEVLPSEREPGVATVRRSDVYYEETIPQMSDEEFRSNFRVNRTTLATIVDIIGEREGNPSGAGMVPTPREKQLLLTLFYLGSCLSFRKVAEQFEMSMSTAYEFVDEVIELLANLKDIFVRLPAGDQLLSTIQAFEDVAGVKGVLGVLSDCHVPIRKPMHEPDNFASYKGFFSFHLQTLCDAQDRITDLCVGLPGSMHEAEVWETSPLASQLQHEHVRDVYVPGDCFLLGSVALPIRPWLMAPFRANRVPPSDARKQNYNRAMAETTDAGRRGIGIMKARFRRLGFVDTKSVKKAVLMVCATCVLHNMCLSLEDRWGEELVEEEDPDPAMHGEPATNLTVAANRRRNRLVDELWSQHMG